MTNRSVVAPAHFVRDCLGVRGSYRPDSRAALEDKRALIGYFSATSTVYSIVAIELQTSGIHISRIERPAFLDFGFLARVSTSRRASSSSWFLSLARPDPRRRRPRQRARRLVAACAKFETQVLSPR